MQLFVQSFARWSRLQLFASFRFYCFYCKVFLQSSWQYATIIFSFSNNKKTRTWTKWIVFSGGFWMVPPAREMWSQSDGSVMFCKAVSNYLCMDYSIQKPLGLYCFPIEPFPVTMCSLCEDSHDLYVDNRLWWGHGHCVNKSKYEEHKEVNSCKTDTQIHSSRNSDNWLTDRQSRI